MEIKEDNSYDVFHFKNYTAVVQESDVPGPSRALDDFIARFGDEVGLTHEDLPSFTEEVEKAYVRATEET